MKYKHKVFWVGLSPALFAVLLAVFLFVCALTGCAENPVAAAHTLEQRAYAVYGTFVVVEQQAANLLEDPSTPDTLKADIRRADALAKPDADALVATVTAFNQAGGAQVMGIGSVTDVARTKEALTAQIVKSTSAIQALTDTVRSAPVPGTPPGP